MEPLSPRLIKSIFKYACSTALINNFKLNVFTFEDYCVAMEYIHITKDINTKKDKEIRSEILQLFKTNGIVPKHSNLFYSKKKKIRRKLNDYFFIDFIIFIEILEELNIPKKSKKLKQKEAYDNLQTVFDKETIIKPGRSKDVYIH